jgi:hypothetical protein
VSFYTTELPQYALIESVLGLGAWVVHVGASMTYTLLVLRPLRWPAASARPPRGSPLPWADIGRDQSSWGSPGKTQLHVQDAAPGYYR